WPGEDPFTTGRAELMAAVKTELGGEARNFHFHDLSDAQSLFRFSIRTLRTEIAPDGEIGMSTLLAAWNAASYVSQIEDARLSAVLNRNLYVDATRAVLRAQRGL